MLRKILIGIAITGIGLPVFAVGTWYKEVTIKRINTVRGSGVQIVADKGCTQQATPTNYVYITNVYGSDNEHMKRIMSMLLTAQSTGKLVTMYADCSTNIVGQSVYMAQINISVRVVSVG